MGDEREQGVGCSGLRCAAATDPTALSESARVLEKYPDPSIVQAQIESAEAAHLLAATLLVPYMVYACAHGWLSAVAWIMVVQIGFNLYPVLHLRWARVRINRLDDRMLSRRTRVA